MIFVQIESVNIAGLKNVIIKKFKMVPRYDGNLPKSLKRCKKCLHAGQNILRWRNSAKLNF